MPAAVVLCFLLRSGTNGAREVLLGRKKTGFGRGRTVGLGGHIEPGETAAAAICREVREESGVLLAEDALQDRGTVRFVFPTKPAWDMDAAIFVADRWTGEPVETAEIAPCWYGVDALPVETMWQDAEHWLPRFLAGEHLDVTIVLRPDHESVESATATPRTPRAIP